MPISFARKSELLRFLPFIALNANLIISRNQTVRKTRLVWFVEIRHVLRLVHQLTSVERFMLVFEFYISLQLSPWGAIVVSTVLEGHHVEGFLATSAHNRAPQPTLNCVYSKIKKFIDFSTFSSELTCVSSKLNCLWTKLDKGLAPTHRPTDLHDVKHDLNLLPSAQLTLWTKWYNCHLSIFYTTDSCLQNINGCCFINILETKINLCLWWRFYSYSSYLTDNNKII